MGKNSTCKVFLKQCLKNLTVGGETGKTSENTHSGYWELTRPRMVILPQVEEEQGEASVWRNVLEVRCKDLIQADQAERDLSVHVPGKAAVPQSVQNY
jgi:hypothetical protein